MGQYNQQPDFATIANAVVPSDAFTAANKVDGAAVFVGTGGDIAVIMKNVEPTAGNTVVFKNVQDGFFLPVIVDYIAATGTTAADLIAIK